jgi:hypothetical protein
MQHESIEPPMIYKSHIELWGWYKYYRLKEKTTLAGGFFKG